MKAETSPMGRRDPRPTLKEFADPRHRDRFVASAARMETITRDKITTELDDNAISRI